MVIKHVVSQPDPPFAYHIWFENARIVKMKVLGSRLHNWPRLTNERRHGGYVPFLYDLWETCDMQAVRWTGHSCGLWRGGSIST